MSCLYELYGNLQYDLYELYGNFEYDLYDKYDKFPHSNAQFSHLSPTATYGYV